MEKAHISKEGLVSRRADLEDLLKRRFYIMQSFGIYGGKAGLYDYGPPGCAIKANVEKIWRDHFVIEEDMLEISATNITPDIVLRASGHEEKFSDIMVNDVEKKEIVYRADHLIEEFIEETKTKQKDKLTPEKLARFDEILRRINEYKVNDIEEIIKELGIKSTKTGNALSKPYEFNLMFAIQIGPTGDSKGYLRPETAQGIFVNFRNLLEYNGGRVPFACAQLGIGFRNEIAPRGGLLRLREFGMAEIEHFVDPEDKSHPKFDSVKNYALPLYHRHQQENGLDSVEMTLTEAISQKIINNETLAYFIARTHQFLVRVGIRPEGIRFRQHLGNEMAHYSQDCWDAEVLTSYGWVEVVGIADRSAFDLTRHTKYSKKDLVAARKFTQAKEIEVLEIKLAKPVIGKAFKAENKLIVEALETMDENTRKAAQDGLAQDKTWTLTLEDGRTFAITPDMISFELKKKRVMEEKFTPHVIEPSFGIGRIIYCSWEHSFKMRSKERTYLHIPPKIAPYKCSLLTVVTDPRFDPFVNKIVEGLKKYGISNKVDTTGQGIGKRYARTDEVGIPFGITIDHETLDKETVTLREIDTTLQVRVPVNEIVDLVYNLSEEIGKWEDVLKKYPQFTPSSQE